MTCYHSEAQGCVKKATSKWRHNGEDNPICEDCLKFNLEVYYTKVVDFNTYMAVSGSVSAPKMSAQLELQHVP